MNEDDTFNKISDRRNLYLVETKYLYQCDHYAAMVIAAWTEDEARCTSPCGNIFNGDDSSINKYSRFSWQWVKSPADVTVTLIGYAKPGLSGVIISDFDSGRY